MRKIADNILNVLYPRCCPICHQILKDQGRMICESCQSRLRPIGQPWCFRCGKPVEEGEYCRDCRQRSHVFDQGRGIFLYDEQMRRSITRFKYYGCREYGDFYAKAMSVYAAKELERWKPDLILPVPMRRARQRQRGFNQSAYLAVRLGEYTGIPVAVHLTEKIRKTKSQKKLTASQRRKNLEAAFRVRGEVRGLRILVVDDVYTTGSTMDAMAVCLKRQGAEKVWFLTVCTGRS